MSEPLVSALINTYNYGRFIEDAVESVLAQEYPSDRIEIIVADDGSTDDTPQRMARYAGRIRYMRLAHGGQAAAMNAQIIESRGKIVAFLDADDMWRPDKVRRVVDAFASHPDAGMVYHPFQLWRPDGKQAYLQDFRAVSGFIPSRLEDLLNFEGVATSGLAFRKYVLDEMMPLPEELIIGCSDGYLCYNCIFGWPVVALGEPLTRYRLHGDNCFNFDRANLGKLRTKQNCVVASYHKSREWILARGYDPREPGIAAWFKKHELWEEAMEFDFEVPSRLRLFRHLRELEKLYGPIWPWRYRAFKFAAALLALLVGYKSFHAMRGSYQYLTLLRRTREAILPRMRRESLPRSLAAH